MRDVLRKIGVYFGVLEDPDPPPAKPFSVRSSVVLVLFFVVVFAAINALLSGGLDVGVAVSTVIVAVLIGGGQVREYRRHRRASRTSVL